MLAKSFLKYPNRPRIKRCPLWNLKPMTVCSLGRVLCPLSSIISMGAKGLPQFLCNTLCDPIYTQFMDCKLYDHLSLSLCRTFSEGRRYEKVAVNSKRTGVGSTCSRNSSRPGKERTLHFRDLESGRAIDEQDQGQSARNSSKGNLIDNPTYADPSSNEDLLDNLAYGDPSKGDDSAAYGDPGGNEDLLYNTAYGDCGRNDDNPAYEDLLDTPAAYGDPGGNEDLLDNPAYGDRGKNDDTLAYGDPEGNVYIEELITNPAYGVTSSEGDYAIPQSLTGDEDMK